MNAIENLNELPSRTYHLPYQCQHKILRILRSRVRTSLIYINSDPSTLYLNNGNGIFLVFLATHDPIQRCQRRCLIFYINNQPPPHFVCKRERDTRCGRNEEKDELPSRAGPRPVVMIQDQRNQILCANGNGILHLVILLDN